MNTDELIRFYCNRTHTHEPIYFSDKKNILTRMVGCGMITQKEMNEYVEKHKGNDDRGTLFRT